MKLSTLEILINKIKKDIKCPSCNVIFDESEVKIVNIECSNLQLEAFCKKCEHISNVSVHVQKEQESNDQKVDKMISAIKNFKGRNIRKLFE
jgi:hypothetical protein